MSYTWEDFGLDKNGPQFKWLDARLTVHGHPPLHVLDAPKDRTRRFQLKQGWTGNGADGLVGPLTLKRLTADPAPPPSSNVIELSKFKRTLPTGEPDHPTELYPLTDATEPVTFRARCDGVTTSGSSYPRDELREILPDDEWSNESGTHTMTGRWAITHTPVKKPHVVCAQIHDDDTKVIMVRLEGSKLFVEDRNGEDVGLPLDDNYRLGTPFDLTIVANPQGIKVIYNGTRSVSLGHVGSGFYFKAGCYTQSNTSKGDKPDAYGEVVIYALTVGHTQ